MTPDARFVNLPKSFWAHVRSLSQEIGYVERIAKPKTGAKRIGPIKVPSPWEMRVALQALGLNPLHVVDERDRPTDLGAKLLDYFDFRARILNTVVEKQLMNAAQAAALYDRLKKRLAPRRATPLNKQSQEKKKPAYFTGIVNMLIESAIQGGLCDYDPRKLTTVTRDGAPFRTLARRVDGAFPSPVNPVAVWEIKEYYYTTTFGSRVADGVYESLLDGMELEEIAAADGPQIKHYLMIDAYDTWWLKGRSYLCRIVDMLHMGYVDEVLVGRDVIERIPKLVVEWAATKRTC